MRVYLSCPKCGSTSFKVSSEPQTLDQYRGKTCLGCGTFMTGEEVRERIEQLARKNAKLSEEVEAEFEEASKMPASFRSGTFQSDPDFGIDPEGGFTSVWKPPNPEE